MDVNLSVLAKIHATDAFGSALKSPLTDRMLTFALRVMKIIRCIAFSSWRSSVSNRFSRFTCSVRLLFDRIPDRQIAFRARILPQ